MTHIRRTSDTNSGMTDDFRTGSIRVASRISLIIVPEQWVKKCSNNSNMGVSQAERYGICGTIDTMVKAGLPLGLGVVCPSTSVTSRERLDALKFNPSEVEH